MGKRSNFKRREADFYPTPRAPVVPLIPYLRLQGIRSFAEPCAGNGALVRHLEAFGLCCVYSGDIRTGQDALTRDSYGAIDAIITNPPYTRELMHPLIEHFQRIAPTWLLLETDWMFTRQAEPFIISCSRVVRIGRVKWFEGSKHNSKDNYGWFRFDVRHKSGPVYHWGDPGETALIRHVRICELCGRSYEAQRSSSRFCSPACRQRAHYRKLSVRLNVRTETILQHPRMTSDGSEEFRYVRHADVARFMEEGWEPTPALDGTHHGEYSVLMRRSEQGSTTP
jgi:hypothetical protein